MNVAGQEAGWEDGGIHVRPAALASLNGDTRGVGRGNFGLAMENEGVG